MANPNIHISLAIGKTAAQIIAQYSPLPGLSPAVEILCTILVLVENVSSNKHLCRQLCQRCIAMLDDFAANVNHDRLTGTAIPKAVHRLEGCLRGISTRMHAWTRRSRWEQFTMQKEISEDIQRAHEEISDCLATFQVTAQVEHLVWEREFEENRKRDHADIVESLAEIQSAQLITNEVLVQNTELLQKLMTMMQQNILDNPNKTGLPETLYKLQLRTGGLPQLELKSGEVQRLSDRAVKGSWATEVFEGIYLRTEKVAVKTLRPAIISPRVRRRFEREVKVWARVAKLDSGKHILPLYGYCTTGNLGLCMVSPWMKNGNALEYVKQHDRDVDYKHLILGIAQGLQLLHTLEPPVVHGDMKADNIVIDDYGEPLLMDFGLAHELASVDIGDGNANDHGGSTMPFSQSHGVSQSYRWFAPELTFQEGTLSSSADIYAYGMTVLELLTHAQPYDNLKHLPAVLTHASTGKRPRRPVAGSAAVKRGLDDSLWLLLVRCWAHDPTERPSIRQVVENLGA